MKLLVFAHTPPPHHGQSYLVKLMIEGFGGDLRQVGIDKSKTTNFGIECYHVNVQLSRGFHELGKIQLRKLLLLVGYCLQAIWCRFRYGIEDFYYVPAPGQRGALFRDWVVMLLCRPFFKRVIFHWHAAGLTQWIEDSVPKIARWITRLLMGRPNASIVMSGFNVGDGERLASNQVFVVPDGIPDPCPGFKTEVYPLRVARFEARKKLATSQLPSTDEKVRAGGDPHLVKLLYLAHCSREKGLFDALEAVALGNRSFVASKSLLRFHLTVAGEFIDPEERRLFEDRVSKADLKIEIPQEQPQGETSPRHETVSKPAIIYAGFLSGAQKHKALTESDCMCFPTYFHAESFGLVIIEAMAFGLPVLATRWRAVPELFPANYIGLVEIKSPAAIVEGLERLVFARPESDLREIFLKNFTLQTHLNKLADALRSVEDAPRKSVVEPQKLGECVADPKLP